MPSDRSSISGKPCPAGSAFRRACSIAPMSSSRVPSSWWAVRLRGRLPGLRRTARRESPRRPSTCHAPAAPARSARRRRGAAAAGAEAARDSRADRRRGDAWRPWMLSMQPADPRRRDSSDCATPRSAMPPRSAPCRCRSRGQIEPRRWPAMSVESCSRRLRSVPSWWSSHESPSA